MIQSVIATSWFESESPLPVEVSYYGHYADDDEINADQIVEYLREDHDDDTEDEACYSHPQA